MSVVEKGLSSAKSGCQPCKGRSRKKGAVRREKKCPGEETVNLEDEQ